MYLFSRLSTFFFFFFNDTATTEIYTLSLHDALPISQRQFALLAQLAQPFPKTLRRRSRSAVTDFRHCLSKYNGVPDRKSTRLNSSHGYISYAVFCLKKKKH